MRLKISFSFTLLLFGLFLFSPLAFASVEKEVIELELHLEDLEYIEVSEEEVILDYMKGKGVDRETAIKELGINEKTIMGSCPTSWRYYSSPKVQIDKLSSSYLTVHPYILVESCTFRDSFVQVSNNVNYTLDDPMNVVRFDGEIQAQLNGSNRVQVAAKGHIRNVFGFKLRDWVFNSTIYAMPEIISGVIKY